MSLADGVWMLALTPWQWAGIVVGVGLAGSGLGVVWVGRRWGRSVEDAAPLPGFAELSPPTRMTLGVCLLIGGYHVAGYSMPDSWVPLKVPRHLWGVVPGAIVVALAGSVAADRLDPPDDASDQRDAGG